MGFYVKSMCSRVSGKSIKLSSFELCAGICLGKVGLKVKLEEVIVPEWGVDIDHLLLFKMAFSCLLIHKSCKTFISEEKGTVLA